MAVTTRDTRQDIAQVALQLMQRQGYGSTSIQQIADAAGISKGNLTYHFRSKQDLFLEAQAIARAYVLERVILRSFDESGDTLAGAAEFTRRIRRWLLDGSGAFVGCLFTNLAIETRHTDGVVATACQQALDDFRSAIARQFHRGQERGEIRADVPAGALAQAFFWMYEGAISVSKAKGEPSEFDAFRAYLPTWLCRGAAEDGR